MTIPNNTPNTTFNRMTPNDGLLFGTEFSRLYANDNSLQDQANILETAFDPQNQLSNSPNWTSPSTSITPSAKALDVRAKNLLPIKRFSGWLADFWISRSPPSIPYSSNMFRMNSVCWSPELHLFVAVGWIGFVGATNWVMRSSNGINWELLEGVADYVWNSVCWSPELHLFVAVATNGTGGNAVMTSTNGAQWILHSSAISNNDWESICWSPELHLFVAVGGMTGSGSQVMTSSNGIDWNFQPSGIANNNKLFCVCWSPELHLFVAGCPAAGMFKSSDGINWTAANSTVPGTWMSVCWSSELNLFVAVSGTTEMGQRIITSSDGNNWVLRAYVTIFPDIWFSSVCWSSELGLFVIVSENPNYAFVMSSPDGLNWTTRTGVKNTKWNSVCWSPELGMFVAVGDGSVGNPFVMTTGTGLGQGYLG